MQPTDPNFPRLDCNFEPITKYVNLQTDPNFQFFKEFTRIPLIKKKKKKKNLLGCMLLSKAGGAEAE